MIILKPYLLAAAQEVYKWAAITVIGRLTHITFQNCPSRLRTPFMTRQEAATADNTLKASDLIRVQQASINVVARDKNCVLQPKTRRQTNTPQNTVHKQTNMPPTNL